MENEPIAPPAPNIDPSPPVHRDFSIFKWLCVIAFFGLLISLTLFSISKSSEQKAKNPDVTGNVTQLKIAYLLDAQPGSERDTLKKRLQEASKDVLEGGIEGPDEAIVYSFCQNQLEKKIDLSKIQVLATSKSETGKKLYRFYQTGTKDPDLARELISDSKEMGPVGKLVEFSARQRLNQPKVATTVWPMSGLYLYVVFALGAFGLLMSGVLAWIIYFVMRSKGLQPEGHPMPELTKGAASDMGLYAVAMIAMFFVMSTLGDPLPGNMAINGAFFGGLFLLGLILILKKKKFQGRSALSWLNPSTMPISKQIAWGFAGFCANLPVILVLGLLISPLIKDSNPSHPVQELVQQGGFITLFGVFLSASVIAPIWEEIAFRWALMGGILRATGKPILAVILSAFAFAAIHPQGPALWLILGWVGAMSSLLAYHTKSLIPSIVMHALHNTAILTLSIVLTS